MHLLSLYGYATAGSPEERRRLNRELYEGTLAYARSFGRVPIFVVGDINPNPAEQDLVEEAIAGTEWTDVHSAWAEGPEHAANTYLREGPYEGVVGKGATRPDRVLANREGLAAVKHAWVDYDADNGSHALPVVELDLTVFRAEYRTLARPKKWDVKQLKEKQDAMGDDERRALEDTHGGTHFAYRVRALLSRGQVAEAFMEWCTAAENYTVDLAGIGAREAKKHRGRANCPRFRKEVASAKLQRGQQARGETTYEVSMLAKLERRVSELVAKLSRR